MVEVDAEMTLRLSGFQEWRRVLEVGPVGIRLIISVLAAGPIGPVVLVPADKADVAVGWECRAYS